METLKVIKIGGNSIDDEAALNAFLNAFSKLDGPKLLVHGGGKWATKLANDMQVEVEMVDGRRITNAKTLDIIIMVYAGKINKMIVAKLQERDCNAVGFSGADGNTIEAVKRPVKTVDYGFVGDVVKVNAKTINVLLENQITPVFCAISHNNKGQLLNTNADTIASELAIALTNHFNVELYYCFEKKGVLQNINDQDSVIKNITTSSYQNLIKNNVIIDGMLPKLNNCFHAISGKVNKVCIGQPEMVFNSKSIFTTIEK